MGLAERLGFSSVENMRRELTEHDLLEWLAFFQIQNEYTTEQQLRMAATTAAVQGLGSTRRR